MAQELARSELTEAEKARLISEAQKDIDQIYKEFENPNALNLKIWNSERKNIIIYWAERLELIYKLQGKVINTIANFITKELQRFDLVKGDYTYAYDVLPACYKSHRTNPADDYSVKPRENTSITALDPEYNELCKKENASLIAPLMKAVDTINEFIGYLSHDALISNIKTEKDRLDLLEFIDRLNAATEHLRAEQDFRTHVSPMHKGQYFTTFTEATENECAKLFFLHARQLEKISGKQSHNILFGLVTDVPWIFEPENMAQALKAKFMGIQCRDPAEKGCESWRIKKYFNQKKGREMFYCHRCKHWFNVEKLLLPGPAELQKRSVQLNIVTLQAPPNVTATVGAW